MEVSTAFVDSFLSNFFADVAALFLASVLLPFALSWRELPKVALVNTKGRQQRFKFSKTVDEQWETTLTLNIRNGGRHTLEKYYWEIYFPHNLVCELEKAIAYEEKIPTLTEVGERFTRVYGYMEVPLFTLDDIPFPYRLKIKTKEKHKATIYYFFRTEYGTYPFYAWIATWKGWFRLLKKISIE